jgi:FdhD protein
MRCRVEQSSEPSETNAPAPEPLNVTYREYDTCAQVSQAAPKVSSVGGLGS